MKRFFLFLIWVLSSLTMNAYDFEVGGIYYKIKKGELWVTTQWEVFHSNSIYLYSGDIVIPSTVDYKGITYTVVGIEEFAFYACPNLKSVVIPNSVKTIEGHAFQFSRNLKSVNIPNGVTTIGDYLFLQCSSLLSVNIPYGVTIIGSNAFEDCYSLTSIDIPNSVEIIDYMAFKGCRSLTSLTIPNSVTTIEECAFFDCDGLTSVTIPSSVKTIGDFIFQGCSNLQSAIVGKCLRGGMIGTKLLGEGLFWNCPNLTSLTITSDVEMIAVAKLFNSNLNSLISLNPIPPIVTYHPNPFEGVKVKTINLYVPLGSGEAYRNASPWNNFKSIIEIDATEINNVVMKRDYNNNSVYNLKGIKVSDNANDLITLPKGVYIINGKKIIIK